MKLFTVGIYKRSEKARVFVLANFFPVSSNVNGKGQETVLKGNFSKKLHTGTRVGSDLSNITLSCKSVSGTKTI